MIRQDIFLHNKNKLFTIKWAVGAAILFFLAFGIYLGQWIVQSQTKEVYYTYFNNEFIGMVSSPTVIKEWLSQKKQEYQSQYPNINIVLNEESITWKNQAEFNPELEDDTVLQNLESKVSVQASGVEVNIDGNTIGIVKDSKTAEWILQQVKEKYLMDEKNKKPVSILSTNHDEAHNHSSGKSTLESSSFTQNVVTSEVNTEIEAIDDPNTLLELIFTGSVQPVKYSVKQEDTISGIAQKYNIPRKVIYDNNPWIENDFLRIDDELDLTVLQPLLSVKTVETFTEVLEMPYGTLYEEDKDMLAGTTKVLVQGKAGLKKVNYQLTKINGELVEENPVGEIILQEPVTAVIKQGTKVIPGIGTGNFAWPVKKAKITSKFGKRWGSFHEGTDKVSSDRNILASDNGKVIQAGWNGGYGNSITIDHQNGYTTLYAHLSKINVEKDQIINKGEKIGIMGTTGNSTGVHLHFEIAKDGEKQNPLKYLNQ